eukprot:2306287-Pyramimonas_sp.AAC.1
MPSLSTPLAAGQPTPPSSASSRGADSGRRPCRPLGLRAEAFRICGGPRSGARSAPRGGAGGAAGGAQRRSRESARGSE